MNLFELFASISNPRFHGETIDGESKNAKGKLDKDDAATKRYHLTQDLFDQHQAGRLRLGVAPLLDDASCCWGAIDIDVYKDFPLEEFLAKAKEVNDRFIPVRTRSGGLHLYVFFSPARESHEFLKYLKELIQVLGLPANTETRPASAESATASQIAARRRIALAAGSICLIAVKIPKREALA